MFSGPLPEPSETCGVIPFAHYITHTPSRNTKPLSLCLPHTLSKVQQFTPTLAPLIQEDLILCQTKALKVFLVSSLTTNFSPSLIDSVFKIALESMHSPAPCHHHGSRHHCLSLSHGKAFIFITLLSCVPFYSFQIETCHTKCTMASH